MVADSEQVIQRGEGKREIVGSRPIPRFHSMVGAVSILVALLPLVLIAIVSLKREISPGLLTRDPTAIGGIHPLSGALSNLGILLWWTSAIIWIGSAYLLRSVCIMSGYRFAISSGLLSAYLALDDLFQFHDIIGPEYIGISENAVYLILAITIAVYVATFWRQIFRRDGVLLLLSFGLLGVSTMMDTILEPMLMRLGRWLVFFEDAA